jgi:hypothetical protein
MAGAACFFPACYSSPTGNGHDEEWAVLVFHGQMKGQRSKLFWKEKIQEICFQTRFKYAMETTFG